MPEIIIKNLENKSIAFNLPNQISLLHLLLTGMDLMHSCGGKGRCTTCKLDILSVEATLPPDTPNERNYKKMGALGANQRLACQIVPEVNLEVVVPKSTQLPHLKYDF